jgi:hypothetical protein
MRIRLTAISLMLLAAACGGGDLATQTQAPAPTVSDGSATQPTAGSPGSTVTLAPTATAAPAEGPIAPDFTTILSDGTEFNLASHDRPVYLVFWAEW